MSNNDPRLFCLSYLIKNELSIRIGHVKRVLGHKMLDSNVLLTSALLEHDGDEGFIEHVVSVLIGVCAIDGASTGD